MDINTMHPRTGRIIKEDGTVINQADIMTLDLRGLAANKPSVNTVAVGTTYWSVDTNVVEVSTGTAWVVV